MHFLKPRWKSIKNDMLSFNISVFSYNWKSYYFKFFYFLIKNGNFIIFFYKNNTYLKISIKSIKK